MSEEDLKKLKITSIKIDQNATIPFMTTCD
jgi:hypothetical protein